MTQRSPFENQRWELESPHIIWLPPRFNEWESRKCVYFTGSRGTGKTTLLKGFEWYQRLNNKSIEEQLISDPFAEKYIGIYLLMTDLLSTKFNNWPPSRKGMDTFDLENESARLFCLFLEYHILQLSINAILELKSKNILKFRPSDEKYTARSIFQICPEIAGFIDKKDEFGLMELGLAFNDMHKLIVRHAIYKKDINIELNLPVSQMGKALENVSSLLIDLCMANEIKTSTRWFFKICIDQAESLEYYQQKAINTMVGALGTSDVSFAIAFLSGSNEMSKNYLPNHALTEADRIVVSLEDVYSSRRDFLNFVTKVTELRIKRILATNEISFDLKKILGDYDLNYLIYNISFKNSESESVRSFIAKSSKHIYRELFIENEEYESDQLSSFCKDEISADCDMKDSTEIEQYIPSDIKSNIPPLYQIYLVDKLKTDLNGVEDDRRKIRAIKSKIFRKKMVAAMLCLCNEYRVVIPFAGYKMILSMSDHCIRDYFRFMQEIFLAEKQSIENFINRTANETRQDRTIKKVSQSRYDNIESEIPFGVSQIRNMIDALGRITSNLQSNYKDPACLSSPERGRFQVSFADLRPEKLEQIKNIIQLAIECHSIKIIEEDIYNKRLIFRLHRIFAPKYRYSYRGAIYNVPLDANDLLTLCLDNNNSHIINRIISHNKKPRNQVNLNAFQSDKDD